MNTLSNRHGLTALVIVFLALFSLLHFPPLVGAQEAHHVFRAFVFAEPPPLKLVIQMRANNAGYLDPFGYVLVHLVRVVNDFFGLSYTLFNLRLIPILYGALGLFFFYRFTRRWFGQKAALLSVLLLGGNPVFFLFQHQLMPTIPAFFCICFFLERLQNLLMKTGPSEFTALPSASEPSFIRSPLHSLCDTLPFVIGSYAFACALIAPQYIMARLVLLGGLAFHLKFALMGNRGFSLRPKQDLIRHLKLYSLSFAGFLLWMAVFRKDNLKLFFAKSFLNPETAENSLNHAGVLNAIGMNIEFYIRTLFLGISPEKDIPLALSNVVADAPAALLSLPALLVFCLGFFLFLRKIKEIQFCFLYSLLFLLTVPLLLSAVYNGVPTLSVYRSFYSLIPMSLLMGLALQKVALFLQTKAPSLPAGIAWVLPVLFLLGVDQISFGIERSRFQKKIEAFDFQIQQPAVGKAEELSRRDFLKGEWYVDQIYLYHLARYLSLKVQAGAGESQAEGAQPVWVYLPFETYTPQHRKSWLGMRFEKKHILQAFLPLYLNQMGVSSSYVVETQGGDLQLRFDDSPRLLFATDQKEVNYLEKNFPHAKRIPLY